MRRFNHRLVDFPHKGPIISAQIVSMSSCISMGVLQDQECWWQRTIFDLDYFRVSLHSPDDKQKWSEVVFVQMPFVQENLVENIPLAKEHNLIMNPLLHDFKVFYPTCSLSGRKFKKMNDDLVPKGQFLGGWGGVGWGWGWGVGGGGWVWGGGVGCVCVCVWGS